MSLKLVPRIEYGSSCSLSGALCDTRYNLQCVNSICSCQNNSAWNGSSCTSGYFGGACNATSLTCWANKGKRLNI